MPSLVSGLVGTVMLLAMFALALPLDVSAGTKAAEKSALRFAIDAKGKVDVSAVPEGVVLPEGADPAKIFGGSHFPISARLIVDGKSILEETYKPSGVSGNGRISALEFLQIESGVHQVEVWIKDDSKDYRLSYSGEVNFEQGRAIILAYDDKTDTFVLR
jgi:hypothetical protein